MRTAIIIMFALIMAAVPTAAVLDAEIAGAGKYISLSMLKYEPVPAYPGDAIDIWLKVDNTGGDVAKNVELEFVDTYPFTLENTNRRIHTINALAGGYDYVAKFKVRVDRNAPTGTSFIKAKYSFGQGSMLEELIEIEIDSRITSLSIESVERIPLTMSPGEEGTVIVKVKNLANSVLRNVKIKGDLSASNVPFAPLGTATERRLDELLPGETYDFELKGIVELDAVANVYTIPLNISFTEDTGVVISYTDFVSVFVKTDPDLILTVDSSDIYSDSQSGTITFRFVNKGLDEIKFLYVNFLEDDSYDMLSPSSNYYIGNIDSDDYEVEDIMIRAKSTEKLNVPMELEYRDVGNKLYNTKETISVNLVKKEEIEGKQSNSKSIVIVILILAGIGFFVWRRRRRKSKE